VFTEPGTARQEAERLVAAALAVASLAANARPDLATGSAACCVCPFCRLIEAVRDPDPQLVERLATGAGDLAVGLAGLLRSFAPDRSTPPAPRAEPPGFDAGTPDDPWHAATTAAAPSTGNGAAPKSAKKIAKKIAKKAVKKAVKKAEPAPPDEATSQVKKKIAEKSIKKAMPKPGPEANG
jgi:hypothetical protein